MPRAHQSVKWAGVRVGLGFTTAGTRATVGRLPSGGSGSGDGIGNGGGSLPSPPLLHL